jgi:hypothetical protein
MSFQLDELRFKTATSATLAAPASRESGIMLGTLDSTYEEALFHQPFKLSMMSPSGFCCSAATAKAGRVESTNEGRMVRGCVN